MSYITKATLNEVKPLAELFDRYRVFYNYAPDIAGAERFIEERILNDDAEIFVCIGEKDNILGFTQLFPLFSSTRMKKLWLLNDLYVDENHRGKGVGNSLIEKSKQLCNLTGACAVILETSKDNIIGNLLYAKTGFKLDREHNFYSWTIE